MSEVLFAFFQTWKGRDKWKLKIKNVISTLKWIFLPTITTVVFSPVFLPGKVNVSWRNSTESKSENANFIYSQININKIYSYFFWITDITIIKKKKKKDVICNCRDHGPHRNDKTFFVELFDKKNVKSVEKAEQLYMKISCILSKRVRYSKVSVYLLE